MRTVKSSPYRLLRSKFILLAAALLALALALAGCSSPASHMVLAELPDQSELKSYWPHGVFYEIFVMAFYDSDGDGIGDIQGMTQKLDYLQELGVEGIWLMPISPSPSYHKYDVTDYYEIDPEYGSLDDFKEFVSQAQARGIRVVIDLVVNHSSSEHPWFLDALSSKDSPYSDWYVWAEEDTNIMERGEWGQQVWHGTGDNRYYGVFWGGMPDLNFDNPEVREEMIKIGRFWLEEVGVDGFRLDAAKHIFSKSEEKNHQWWEEFGQAMRETKEDVFLVGEVWATTTVVGPYLENGLTSAFNFDLAEKIVSAARQESDTGIASSLARVRNYFASLNESYIDSTFLTNHDMNRVMNELRGDENKARMAASILLTLPGNPFIYYGEEIGMEGAKPDEHIREPLLWYNDPTETGQTAWIRAKHNRTEPIPTVEAQLADADSLYEHYRSMIYVRRSSDILIKGEIETSAVRESGLVSYKRVLGTDSLLVIHNMTGEPLSVDLPESENDYQTIYYTTSTESVVDSKNQSTTITLAAYSTLILQQ